jgi:hypothetical protein
MYRRELVTCSRIKKVKKCDLEKGAWRSSNQSEEWTDCIRPPRTEYRGAPVIKR